MIAPTSPIELPDKLKFEQEERCETYAILSFFDSRLVVYAVFVGLR